MKINCKFTSVNGEIILINIKEKKKELDGPCTNMLQYSNEEIAICFRQRAL